MDAIMEREGISNVLQGVSKFTPSIGDLSQQAQNFVLQQQAQLMAGSQQVSYPVQQYIPVQPMYHQQQQHPATQQQNYYQEEAPPPPPEESSMPDYAPPPPGSNEIIPPPEQEYYPPSENYDQQSYQEQYQIPENIPPESSENTKEGVDDEYAKFMAELGEGCSTVISKGPSGPTPEKDTVSLPAHLVKSSSATISNVGKDGVTIEQPLVDESNSNEIDDVSVEEMRLVKLRQFRCYHVGKNPNGERLIFASQTNYTGQYENDPSVGFQ